VVAVRHPVAPPVARALDPGGEKLNLTAVPAVAPGQLGGAPVGVDKHAEAPEIGAQTGRDRAVRDRLGAEPEGSQVVGLDLGDHGAPEVARVQKIGAQWIGESQRRVAAIEM
jgi:hypothetical protein